MLNCSMLAVLAALLAAPAFAAPPRVLDVRVQDRFRVYSMRTRLDPDGVFRFDGEPLGGAGRSAHLEGRAALEGDAGLVDFFLELPATADGGGLSQSGAAVLRRGLRETVLDCGGWRVELVLDLAAGPPRGVRGNGNYRLTEDVSGRGGAGRCRQVVALAKRSSVRISAPGAGPGQAAFSSLVEFPGFSGGYAEPFEKGAFDLMISLESGDARLSTSTPLRLGKRKSLKAAGGRAELLLEREPGARSGPGLPDADKPTTVPLLR